MDLQRLGFGEVSLIEGEKIDTLLDLRDGAGVGSTQDPEVVLLTDRRVIHLASNGRRRKAVFMAIQDIDGVEIDSEREGRYAAFIWGGLALFVAVMLWQVWDQPYWSVVAAVGVVLMGAYLMVDRLISSATMRATFKAGSSEVQCALQSDKAAHDIYTLVNRLGELQSAAGRDGAGRGTNFAPR